MVVNDVYPSFRSFTTMSDSEEGAFESADEGETVAQSVVKTSGKDKGEKIAEKETGPSGAEISKTSTKDKDRKIAEKETGPSGSQISKNSRKKKGRKVVEKETGPKGGNDDSTRKLAKEEAVDAKDGSSKEEVEDTVPAKVSDKDGLTDDTLDVTKKSAQIRDKTLEDRDTTEVVSREGSGVKKKGDSNVIEGGSITTTCDEMVAADGGRAGAIEDKEASTKEGDKTATDTIGKPDDISVVTTAPDIEALTTDGADSGERGSDESQETEKSALGDEVVHTQVGSKTTRRVERRQPSTPEEPEQEKVHKY